ncbi:MAG: protein phosphatase 2C domain-containing protein [Pseudonocardiaceae bacterium]
MLALLATEPGHKDGPNEDWAGVTQCVAVVLDGLSTPSITGTGCSHGVPWYVAQLGPRLLSTAEHTETPLTNSLAQAITEVAALHPQCDLTNPGTPSAAVGVVRRRPEAVDYLVLSDALVTLRSPAGLITRVTDNRVDQVAGEARNEALSAAIGSASHRKAVAKLVDAQRPLRNTPQGYWVAAADPLAAEHAIAGSLPVDSVRDVALMTDGASRYVDLFNSASWTETLDLLRLAGPDEVIRRVREQEKSDPDGQRWPRYKLADDATALYVQW